MRRRERRRKFHEAVVNFLYPPPPPRDEEEEDEDRRSFSPAQPKGDPFPDDSRDSGSTSSSDNDGEAGSGGRLTRAQRKRIRKKRLREESVLRGKMIGPLLPSVNDDESGNIQKEETSDVQPNSQVESASCEQRGDAAASTKQRRLKHRRMVKRLAKDSQAGIVEKDRRC